MNSKAYVISTASTGLLIKLLSIIANFVSIPLAVRALGIQEFALYAITLSLLGWSNLINFGVSSNTLRALSGATSITDTKDILLWYLTKQFKLIFFVPLISIIFIALNPSFDKTNYSTFLILLISAITSSLNWLSLPVIAYINHNRRLFAYQLGCAFASIFSILTILNLHSSFTDAWQLLAINFLPLAIVNLAAILLCICQGDFLRIILGKTNKNDSISNIQYFDKDCFLIDQLNSFFTHVLPVYLLSFHGALEATLFSITLTIIASSSTLQLAITRPMKSVISSCSSAKAIKLLYKSSSYSLAFSSFIALIFLLFGEKIVNLWYGGEVALPNIASFQILTALYLIAQSVDSNILTLGLHTTLKKKFAKRVCLMLILFVPLLFFSKTSATTLIIILLARTFTLTSNSISLINANHASK